MVHAKVPEHIVPVSVDFLGRWSLPVLGEHPASRLERDARRLLFECGREVTFQNLTRVTIGGNAMCIRLHLQGRCKLLWKFDHEGTIPAAACRK